MNSFFNTNTNKYFKIVIKPNSGMGEEKNGSHRLLVKRAFLIGRDIAQKGRVPAQVINNKITCLYNIGYLKIF